MRLKSGLAVAKKFAGKLTLQERRHGCRKKTVSNKVQSYLRLIQRLAMLLYNTKLYYGLNNPVVMKESAEVLAEIENLTSKKDTLTFSVLGSTMFLNGEKLEIRDGLSKQFLLSLAKLGLGALDLRPGLTASELSTLMVVLINNASLKGKPEIKKYLDEHGVKHIIPHLATYQLVQENEQVVKDGSVVNVDKLSSRAIKDYASDLKRASPDNKTAPGAADEINKFLFNLAHNRAEEKNTESPGQLAPVIAAPAPAGIIPGPVSLKDAALKSGGQEDGRPSLEVVSLFAADLKNGVIRDKHLMRDPLFLCRVLTNLAQAMNTVEELSRVIGIIGGFLIADISATREIEARRKMCAQLNDHLIAQWEQKESKAQGRQMIAEAFALIIAALQVKKYLLAYLKHKRGLEAALKKTGKLLKDVPADNALHQQIKNELRKIGAPKYDDNMFA